ncbi:MAG: ABC transporter permease, partial [Anaerolineae bacterium]|nr:ABC transporter permease [Anaerolineae bacterium]
MSERLKLRYVSLRYPFLFALILLIVAVLLNFALQPNLFQTRVLNGNMRTFLPLMILAVGQTVVIIGGGIDLSVGAIVSLVTAVLVTQMTPDASPTHILLVILLACGVGMAAGALNGFCVSRLRLPPIVTTYATAFIFSGLALWILPRPGGSMPEAFAEWYRRATPLGIPLGIWVGVVLVLLWYFFRGTKYGSNLFAVGGKAEAAYATAVPVTLTIF